MDTGPSRLPRFRDLLVVALLLAACSGRPAREGPDTVLLLHTNDIHSHLLPGDDGIGGMARIAGYVERERAVRADVLFLDAGDGVAGTPVSSLFQGRPAFAVMNSMGYDAMAVGNHEFDHGWPLIEQYREIAAFPILCANASGPGGRPLADAEWVLIEVDGVRVGVIGVVTPMTPEITAGGCTDGCEFRPAALAVRRLLPEVEKKADLVVVLSHLGFEEDKALAKEVPEIDVIVGGHSHTEVKEPVRVGQTIVVQAYEYGKRIGRLELTVEDGRVTAYTGGLVTVNAALPISGRTRAVVDVWEDRVRERVDVKIGRSEREYGKKALAAPIERIYRETLRTDFGFQNRGGIRATLPKGDILARHIWTILPFENTLVTVRVRGSALPKHMAPRGTEIDEDRVYSVATNSFVADHADRYFPDGIEGVTDSKIGMRDAVLDWVKKHGGIE
jgi:2',3'-cyclic-nucleotide 2'-phosphodiesterase (5'-nucleotidase family)